MIKIAIVPTFLLRKVEHDKVLSEYLNGSFSQLTLMQKNENIIQLPVSTQILSSQLTSNFNDDVYSFRNKSNVNQIVATTNCATFVSFISSSTGEAIKGGRCNHCNRIFKNEALGSPVKIEKRDNVYIVYFKGIACRYGCAFALWKRNYNGGTRYRDSLYCNGEQILKFLYHLQYPKSNKLKEAPNPDLLICNGGSLKDEEYDSENYFYCPSPSIILAPIKTQYFQYNNGNK